MVIRLLIVDDQQIVRQGLKMYLQTDADIELVGEAENGEQAIRAAFEVMPSVILMDLLMPIMDGIEAIRAIRTQLPQIALIAVTSVEDEQLTQQALLAGADSLIQKTVSPEKLLQLTKTIAAGCVVLPSALVKMMLAQLNPPDSVELSADERQFINMLVQGSNKEEIKQTLNLDDFQYLSLQQQLESRLNVKGTFLLALSAIKSGLIDAPISKFDPR